MSLRTGRLVLREPVAEDLAALTAIIGDERIPEAQYPARFRTPDRVADVHEAALAHWAQHGFGPWTVERDGVVIGRAGLQHTTQDGEPVVEVVWFLSPDAWGAGYATEAAAAALEAYGAGDVVAFTLHANAASQAVMRRLGFEPAGETERAGLAHVVMRRARTGPQAGS